MRRIVLVAAIFLALIYSVEAKIRRQKKISGARCVHALLCGSEESLKRQNKIADEEGLWRFQNEYDLAIAKVNGLLFVLPSNAHVELDERLPVAYRWCRPWAYDFLNDTGKLYFEKFKMRFQVNSGVRTVKYQKVLRKRNRNAAPAKGEKASSHLTGSAVDITKKGMTPEQIKWMRNFLVAIEENGFVDATEEFNQSVFHIMVFRKYGETHHPEWYLSD